jgi:hypothetical protein
MRERLVQANAGTNLMTELQLSRLLEEGDATLLRAARVCAESRLLIQRARELSGELLMWRNNERVAWRRLGGSTRTLSS